MPGSLEDQAADAAADRPAPAVTSSVGMAEPTVTVREVREVRARISAHGVDPRALLICVGQISHRTADTSCERIGVIYRDPVVGAAPELLVDTWMTKPAARALAAELDLPLDGWDVMFATEWTWAWGGAPFELWSPAGRVLTVHGPGEASLWRQRPSRRLAIARVLGEVSADWVTRRVGVRTTDDETIWLASSREPTVTFDPTYDGLDLLADARWAAELVDRLGRALDRPLTVNDAALAGPWSRRGEGGG